MMISKSRRSDVLKGGFLLMGIVAMIIGLYMASDHAQYSYTPHEIACLSGDVKNCPELLLSSMPPQ